MMSNEGEKRCPLCAEEMDWTDQQFKPCPCGYQVCVWCWHHLINVAEKEKMEGRCPACRSIYEKDKIVAMQENIERTSTKNTTKKTKQSKSKTKTDEGKKDLTNVRVIQRKMAYVIGLPLSLADEDVLVRKEYFGQYGKVTKISLSRTAGGAVQQFINDTCSVYITYSKQEEALRCIQSVHGFVLDGRYLRASFGTAKYCHAWLKNLPCNNTTCLYLHSIGADEDSFGKDEVAAVHTRGRVQQIVGSTNNALERSGNVLPPPEEDVCSVTSGVSEKSSLRSGISETPHDSVNSIGDVTRKLPSKEKEGSVTAPHKATTFVDIVGRSGTSASGKDGDKSENKRIANLSSELSSIKINEDTPAGDPYSFPSLLKVSSSNSIGNEIYKNFPNIPTGEDSLRFDDKGSNDNHGSSQVAFFPFPNYPSITSESSALLHENHQSADDFSMERSSLHNNHEDEASLPMRCVNSVLNNSVLETNLQSSAKCDRIYRSSRSFSNEEIVEHLRRIDDSNLPSDEDKSALDVVERSIISNILSIDFDLCEDSFKKPVFSDLLDETDGLHGSSGNSISSDLVGYPFLKPNGFANQITGSIIPDCGNTVQRKPQHWVSTLNTASGAQSLAPTGFTLPVRYPPPGFSTCDRTSLSRPASGNQLVSASSSFPNTILQSSGPAFNGGFTFTDGSNHFDPTTMLSWANSKLETRASSSPHLTTLNDESRLRNIIQQSAASAHQDSRFSQMSVWPQHPPVVTRNQSYDSLGHIGNGISEGSDTYGLCSRIVDQLQNYSASSFVQIPQQNQKYANGHVSNSNGFRHSLDDARHKGELASLQEYERLGVNKYCPPPGYEDLMFSSDNLYSKLFRL